MFQNGAEKGLFLGYFPIPAPQSLAPLLSLWILSARNSIFIIPTDHALFWEWMYGLFVLALFMMSRQNKHSVMLFKGTITGQALHWFHCPLEQVRACLKVPVCYGYSWCQWEWQQPLTPLTELLYQMMLYLCLSFHLEQGCQWRPTGKWKKMDRPLICEVLSHHVENNDHEPTTSKHILWRCWMGSRDS